MIVTLAPPLLCSQRVAALHRCTNAATIGRVAEQTDGSYQLQTFCPDCAAAQGITQKETAHE